MTGFDAYFYGSKIFINGKKEYTLGEILKKYLSKKFKGLDEVYHKCKRYVGLLHYPEDAKEATSCDEFFQGAIMFYSQIDDLICSLPPYNAMDIKRNRLYDLLNEHGWLFDDEDDGTGERLPYHEYFHTGTPLCDFDSADLIDGVLEFDEKLKVFAMEYVIFIEDLLRVKNVYEPFLELLHGQSKYLDNAETAKIYSEFMAETERKILPYEKLKSSGSIQMSYTVLEQKKSPVLCESYRFDTIGALLYIELFKGLELHHLPKKCGYCGRYFLLEAGIFSDYCTRPVRGMDDKICRDVGHRKKYADKVKNDPIWLTYSRAYKTHYARYMKGKMSQAEFQVWADYALELRQQALDGVIEFEVYLERVRG